ncbi:4-hydroxy-tetrahydrodipicolinate synthase [Sodalis sp. CWE]|uniref:4-hydroxy-tetrahydrodipicolinate synthase n=1 Tax=Sodalis sp. CWE TaxID=2803816 RepID=UPI001C7CA830|nr:4-hydroxy-tetrahydrodipicolinate synthase [Sodalis sp. CWE]MBX4181008.1 4-hydroxy-tetrahydrodipicolinate synthase [Sodalis sp. CWE]
MITYLKGSLVALITPMNEYGAIDQISLNKLINYHIESGTTAIVIAGTTGEISTLTHEEYYKLVTWSIEISEGRIPIISGISTNSTNEAILIAKRFNDSGVMGYLIVTPYFNCPNQKGLFYHFKAIAENSDLPQILYNVPIRTGCDILPSTVARLANIKNIVGIKDATGDLKRVNQIQELVSDNFILLSGDDESALDFMQLGGKGVISVTANVAAKEIAKICTLVARGSLAEARCLNKKLIPLHRNLFYETNPIPIKWACKVVGLIEKDTLRLPMTSLKKSGRLILKKALLHAGLI